MTDKTAPQFALGINTGFAVNRYAEHDEWIRIVGDDDVDRLLERYDAIISLKMFSSYMPSILELSQVEKLLTLIGSEYMSAAKIARSLKAEPSLVLRTVSFMIKIGLLEKAFT